MTQQDDDAILSAEEKEDDKEGKEGKGKAESGALGRGEVAVEAGFFEYMTKVGASAGQISEILKSWRQLRGAGLARALVDFARSMTRASVHAEVEIAPNKDYGLIHNFIQHVKALIRVPAQKHTLNNQNKHQHKNTPEPM